MSDTQARARELAVTLHDRIFTAGVSSHANCDRNCYEVRLLVELVEAVERPLREQIRRLTTERDRFEAELVGWSGTLTNTPTASRTTEHILRTFRAEMRECHDEREQAIEAAAIKDAEIARLHALAQQLPVICDCGEALTVCASCAVADYQAAHAECRTCCPPPTDQPR